MSTTAAQENAPLTTTGATNEPAANGSRSRGSRRNTSGQSSMSNPFNYEGECNKVGVILALKVERFNKKALYEILI